MFIDTDKGAVAVSRIIRHYETRTGDKRVTIIVFDDAGERATATMEPYERDTLLRATDAGKVIPAQPGTYTLWGWLDDDGSFGSGKAYVIAWLISESASVPYTVEGANDGDDNIPPVLMPDGSVVTYNEQRYASLDEWKTATETDLRQRAANKAAEAASETA